jgi:hypothetical protein
MFDGFPGVVLLVVSFPTNFVKSCSDFTITTLTESPHQLPQSGWESISFHGPKFLLDVFVLLSGSPSSSVVVSEDKDNPVFELLHENRVSEVERVTVRLLKLNS